MSNVISWDGTPIAFRRSGHGPPLALLHGSIADHRIWTSVVPAFEEHFTVFTVDRRGRGKSGDAPAYSLEHEVMDILAVVDSLGMPVDLLAHSFGATCALEVALRTRSIRKLALYEPAIFDEADKAPDGLVGRIQALVNEGNGDGAVAAFFRDAMRRPEQEIEKMRSRPAWRSMVAVAGTIPREMQAVQDYVFVPERFRQITVPTLLLLGSESDEMRPVIEVLHGAIPNSRLAILQGQNHSAMSTAPKLLSDVVLRFLAE